MSRRIFLSTGLVLFAVAASAKDWPEFRGPSGQGLAEVKKVPLEWSDTHNVAWKQAIPGLGWSSPVLKDGRLYLTTAVSGSGEGPAGQTLRALCLDEGSGKILWNVEVFGSESGKAQQIHKKNSHASPTPLVADGRVYVHFGHQGTACLDLDGRIVWRNSSLEYPPLHGNGGSPILVGDLLVFNCDGVRDPFIVALDRGTGEIRWKTTRETPAKKKFSFSTPLLIAVNGEQQIVSPGSGAVFAYDPKTGREIWRTSYGEGYSVIPRPVFGHGLIFISTGYETPMLMAIRPGGLGDVTDTHVAWSLKKGAPHTPSPLLIGDELYVVSDGGIASCVEARTGKVHWQERVGGNYSASPIYANGRVYFQNEEGTTVVVKASPQFEKLGENALGERTLASMAVGEGVLFIRSEQHLFKITGG